MPRVFIIPHHQDEQLFSETAATANATQSDFRFHTLPPESRKDTPLMAPQVDFRCLLKYLEHRKEALATASDDLMVAFYRGVLGAKEAGLTNLFVAGARYDEPTPCTAVVSLRFLSWDILESKFDYSLQKHALLHLLVCCLLGAYTHVDAHIATFGCLLDFDARLSDFNRKLSRGYYLCSPQEHDCCRAVQAEKYGSGIIQLCSTLKYKTDQKSIQISIGEFIMGDSFKDIKDSTIINRSKVVNALNTVGGHIDEDTKSAIIEVANIVGQSQNAAAGALLDQFNDELAKPQHDRSKLKQFWSGLTTLLPDIAKLGGAVAKIVAIFA
jgi:hypothetical protein